MVCGPTQPFPAGDQPRAFTALVKVRVVAGIVANKIENNTALAISAPSRGDDMAVRSGDPALIDLTRWSRAGKLTLLTARRGCWATMNSPVSWVDP